MVKQLFLLHQIRCHDQFFYKAENVIARCFGAIRVDLGPGHIENVTRQKALERLLELTEADGALRLGDRGTVWRILADPKKLEGPIEDAPATTKAVG